MKPCPSHQTLADQPSLTAASHTPDPLRDQPAGRRERERERERERGREREFPGIFVAFWYSNLKSLQTGLEYIHVESNLIRKFIACVHRSTHNKGFGGIQPYVVMFTHNKGFGGGVWPYVVMSIAITIIFLTHCEDFSTCTYVHVYKIICMYCNDAPCRSPHTTCDSHGHRTITTLLTTLRQTWGMYCSHMLWSRLQLLTNTNHNLMLHVWHQNKILTATTTN